MNYIENNITKKIVKDFQNRVGKKKISSRQLRKYTEYLSVLIVKGIHPLVKLSNYKRKIF